MSHTCKAADNNVGCISCVAQGETDERNRRTKLLERIQTWYPEKMTAFREGYELAENRIASLIQLEIDRVSNPMLVDREYLDGLEQALEIVKELKKGETE